ncbi:TonB-dependent receptor [Sphingomonas panni]
MSNASRIPHFWLANANLGISPPGTPLTIAAYVYNLFDERIEETRNRFISARTVGIHPPRTLGVRLSYSY